MPGFHFLFLLNVTLMMIRGNVAKIFYGLDEGMTFLLVSLSVCYGYIISFLSIPLSIRSTVGLSLVYQLPLPSFCFSLSPQPPFFSLSPSSSSFLLPTQLSPSTYMCKSRQDIIIDAEEWWFGNWASNNINESDKTFRRSTPDRKLKTTERSR